MAVELATGYVSLIPSAKDFGKKLERELSGELDEVGRDLGRRITSDLSSSIDGRAAGRQFESDFANAAEVDAADVIDVGEFTTIGDKAGDEVGDGLEDGLDTAGQAGPGSFSASFLPGIGVVAGLAGAALAAGLMSAFSAGLERDRDNARLAGQLGLTPAEAREIASVASDVYTDAWGDSVREVNDAIRSVDANLGDVTKMNQRDLKRVTTSALALADVFEVDVNEATRAAGQLVRSGLVKDFDEAFDLITWGFQNGMDRSGDFLDTLNEYAEPLASLGFTGEMALKSLNNALDAGAFNLDKAGDAWKEFSIRAVDGSKLTSEAYETLGLDAEKLAGWIAQGGPAANEAATEILAALSMMTDPVAREAAGVALFGSTWEDLGPQVVDALNPALVSIGDTDGAMQTLIDTQDTAAAKWESWKRTVQESFVNFMANTVIPFIDKNILPSLQRIQAAFEEDGLSGAVRELQALWDEHWPAIQAGIQNAVKGIVDWLVENGPSLAKEAGKIGLEMGKAMGKEFVAGLIPHIEDIPIFGRGLQNVNSMWKSLPGNGGSVFDGFTPRATGGPVVAGQAYVVGELRPELFVPDTSGYVYPEVPSGGVQHHWHNTVQVIDQPSAGQLLARAELMSGFAS